MTEIADDCVIDLGKRRDRMKAFDAEAHEFEINDQVATFDMTTGASSTKLGDAKLPPNGSYKVTVELRPAADPHGRATAQVRVEGVGEPFAADTGADRIPETNPKLGRGHVQVWFAPEDDRSVVVIPLLKLD